MNVNNTFYDQLGERWYQAKDDPVALLRAECRARLPWILERMQSVGSSSEGSRQVLDVACGAGFLSNALARSGYAVTAIDSSRDSLRVAALHDETGTVKYREMDALHLDFPTDSFDFVCAMDFLEHLTERGAFLREVARVLKPGGLFFFHTFNRNPVSILVAIKGLEWFVKNTPPAMHVPDLFIKPEELRQWAGQAGLEIRELQGLNPAILSRAFWKMIFTGEVSDDFEFRFTSSTWVGYTGVAVKKFQPDLVKIS